MDLRGFSKPNDAGIPQGAEPGCAAGGAGLGSRGCWAGSQGVQGWALHCHPALCSSAIRSLWAREDETWPVSPRPRDRQGPSTVTCMQGGTLWPCGYNIQADEGPGRGSQFPVARGHPWSCGASVSPFFNPLWEQSLQVTQGQTFLAGATSWVLGWQQPGTECPMGQGCHPVPVDLQNTGSPQPKRVLSTLAMSRSIPVPCTRPRWDGTAKKPTGRRVCQNACAPVEWWSGEQRSLLLLPLPRRRCPWEAVKLRAWDTGDTAATWKGLRGADAAPWALPSPPPSRQRQGSYFCCTRGKPRLFLETTGAVRPVTRPGSTGPRHRLPLGHGQV